MQTNGKWGIASQTACQPNSGRYNISELSPIFQGHVLVSGGRVIAVIALVCQWDKVTWLFPPQCLSLLNYFRLWRSTDWSSSMFVRVGMEPRGISQLSVLRDQGTVRYNLTLPVSSGLCNDTSQFRLIGSNAHLCQLLNQSSDDVLEPEDPLSLSLHIR